MSCCLHALLRFSATSTLLAAAIANAEERSPSFEREIGPLLQSRCLRCHSGARPKGDLSFTSREGLFRGGASGPVVVPGKAAASLMFQHVRDKKMPPGKPFDAVQVELLRGWIDAGAAWEGPALSAVVNEERRAGKDWWSLQSIRRPGLPVVTERRWVRNPLDQFILAGLDAKGLRPAAETDRRTFIRRVTFDLIGLPPTPEEVEAFVNDAADDAHEKLVDRLLASPHHGERWGRHWLDVVRFAESHGYEMNTLRSHAWPYRDYVIRAFNRDTPFGQFVMEQLAGDTVAGGDFLAQAGTGFLVGGSHDMVGNQTVEGQLQQRMDDLYDMVSTTGSAFLGLTVNCARCHDHKFDPITQRDYYGLQAVFAGVQHGERAVRLPPADRNDTERLRLELAQVKRRLEEMEPVASPTAGTPIRDAVNPQRNVDRFKPVSARLVRFVISATIDGTEPCIDELEIYSPESPDRNLALASAGAKAAASSVYAGSPLHKLEHVNDGHYGNSRSWISREPGKGILTVELAALTRIDRMVWGRDRESKFRDRLARDYRIEVSADGNNWNTVAGSWDRQPYGSAVAEKKVDPRRTLQDRRAYLEGRLTELERGAALYGGTFAAAGPTHILKRGDPMQRLDEVGPGAIAAVSPPLAVDAAATESQRRRTLATWIADGRNPLPARVMVNRLWHYHFAQGLVRTPSDFGFNGDRPSHPELLDWLAAEFLANGGRLKPLHRLIVLSSAYRQSSRIDAAALAVDAGNRLLWRFPPRRLEAEAIRDAVLQTSGSLNRRMGGPGYHLWNYSGYVIVFQPKDRLGPDEFRRMVYQFKPRVQQDGVFGAFDCPDSTQIMPKRNVSTTALQSLNLLNSTLILDQSERFAERLRREAGSDPPAQVRWAFVVAFGREPSAKELAAGLALTQQHGLAVLCRALFNANEFVFVR